MTLKNLDYLSPKISLFFYGRRRHSAFLGGILTILMIITCLTYIFYLCLNVCRHNTSIILKEYSTFSNFIIQKTKVIMENIIQSISVFL